MGAQRKLGLCAKQHICEILPCPKATGSGGPARSSEPPPCGSQAPLSADSQGCSSDRGRFCAHLGWAMGKLAARAKVQWALKILYHRRCLSGFIRATQE